MPTRLPCSYFNRRRVLPDLSSFDLESALRKAAQAGAQTLLLMAGQPPVLRIAGKLSPPLQDTPLDWELTRKLADDLLPVEYRTSFEKNGSADLPFHLAGVAGNLTIFYGNGCHNLVFHLTGGNGHLS